MFATDIRRVARSSSDGNRLRFLMGCPEVGLACKGARPRLEERDRLVAGPLVGPGIANSPRHGAAWHDVE